ASVEGAAKRARRAPGHDRRGLRIALVALASAALFAVAARLVHGPAGGESLPRVPAPPPAQPPPAQPPPVPRASLVVTVEPADAELLLDGVPASPERPLHLQGPVGQVVELQARRPGYRPLTQRLILDGKRELTAVQLEPLPSPAGSAP